MRHALRIPFAFERGSSPSFDLFERIAFWDSPHTVQFFKERGYTLYERVPKDDDGNWTSWSRPVLPFEGFGEAIYPYAYHDAEFRGSEFEMIPLRAQDRRGKVLFAQDLIYRHVAIKLIRDDTDEYRIMRFLSQQNLETLEANCIIPVLELLPIEGFWFAVMPRWGSSAQYPREKTLQDVLGFMHGMLKGIAFLHEHNIVRGDVNEENVYINHFCDALLERSNTIREGLRSQERLSYAIFDFDFSIMLSPDADRVECRLPSELSYGTFASTKDTCQGELDFNPFVFDVGNLGVTFCNHYQHLAKHVPMLAPLLDMMTTRDLQRRFTASEALHFFEDIISKLSRNELNLKVSPRHWTEATPYDVYNRWAHVPPDFAQKWAAYKEPSLPLTTKALRWLCDRTWGYRIVVCIRRFLSRLMSFPQRVHTHFVGLRIL